MGEMTIRLDDAVLVALRQRAERHGMRAESLAADLLRLGLDVEDGDRARRERMEALDKLRSIQNAAAGLSGFDSTAAIREDRDSR